MKKAASSTSPKTKEKKQMTNTPSTAATAIAKQETAVVAFEMPDFLKPYDMLQNPGEVAQIIKENAGVTGIDAFMLDKIKVPSGGGTFFAMPTLDGVEPASTFEGIVIHFADQRSYWQKTLEDGGGDTPPDCTSLDMLNGHGEPGGDCISCPLNAFGSDLKGGRGKACSERRLLFVLLPGEALPTVVSIPPTSLHNVRAFFMRLGSKRVSYYGLVMEFSLEKTKNKGGIEYAQINFKVKAKIEGEALEYVKALRTTLMPVLSKVRAD